ncbi:putative sensor histidine kinase [Lutibaculum baratangense AMV1]|uniref:Putative sensor histidine kinase n=2 Tax=Lutibaculum TaxID=1358438 RepID=V4RFI5_9HYPH|nr:putative sensor histidine kinase [Lutibaculum baratangense AMV1]
MIGAVATVVVATLLVALLARKQPWIGLGLAPDDGGLRIVSVDPAGPASESLEPGDRLVAISAPAGGRIALEPSDIAEDPDAFDSYASLDRFYERQEAISRLLASGGITLR